jgi:hypothetical protein
MKKIMLLLVAVYTVPSYGFFAWGSPKKDTVTFSTKAAQEAYKDCMQGALGDEALTGCKSNQCRKTCKQIGEITQAAEKEGVYTLFATCVFDGNIRNQKGRWLPRGCHMRQKRCWNQCLKWARTKTHHKTCRIDQVKKQPTQSVRKPLLSSLSICAKPWFSFKGL